MLGFERHSSLVLFLFTAVVFGIFCVYRLPILNYETWGKQAGPGEWFVFEKGWPMVWEKVHLRSVLPAGALMPLQFSPFVRRRYTSLHRWIGRLITVLLLLGSASAVYVSQHAFGGTISSQTASFTLTFLIFLSTTRGIRSIWLKRIEVHRVWMIRCWGWTGSILTMRLVNIALLLSYSKFTPTKFHTVTTCERILATYVRYGLPDAQPLSYYPQCATSPPDLAHHLVVVNAVFHLDRKYRPEQNAALIELCFGPAFWVGIVINILCIEWYLSSTSVRATTMYYFGKARTALDDTTSTRKVI